MLKSTKDIAIKRYLAHIGECLYRSREFDTIYYKIVFSDSLIIKIRFSNHFKDTEALFREDEVKNNEYVSCIEIVKTSLNFYTIKDSASNFSITVLEKDIVTYLKSFLLLYPELYSNISSFKNAYTEIHKKRNLLCSQVQKLNSKLKRNAEMTQLVDSVWDENKKLKKEISLLKCQNDDILTTATNLSNENKGLKKKIQKQNTLIVKMRELVTGFMGSLNSKCTTFLNETKDYK